MRDIGYSVSDPRKLRPFEEEERDLVREGRRFLAATAFSLIAIALVARPAGIGAIALPAVVIASLLAFVFLVLRVRGLGAAIGGTSVLAMVAAGLLPLKELTGLIEICSHDKKSLEKCPILGALKAGIEQQGSARPKASSK